MQVIEKKVIGCFYQNISTCVAELREGGKAREGYREIRGINGKVGASPDI